MKTILALSLLFALPVYAADTRSQVATNLVGLHMPPALADYVSQLATGLGVVPNNTFVQARNAAGTANINVFKVDATDDTVLESDTGDVIKFSVAGTTELTLDDDKLTFSGASAKIVPGATSFLFRNNADNASNLSITDAGIVTVRSTLVLSPSASQIVPGVTSFAIRDNANTKNNILVTEAGLVTLGSAADLAWGPSGGTISIQEATAGAKCMGSGTHNGTTAVTISTTCWTTGSRVFLTDTSDPTGSTASQCWVTNGVNGTSFDVDCDTANDATFAWFIIHEAA